MVNFIKLSYEELTSVKKYANMSKKGDIMCVTSAYKHYFLHQVTMYMH